MPKKKIKKVKKKKKIKTKKGREKPVIKTPDKKATLTSSNDEKPEIKKIKKQATEKRVYNLKDYLVYPKHGVGKITAIEKATIGVIDIQFLS